MRITNNMIMGNTKTNINSTKVLVDKYNTQMTTQKKISKASEGSTRMNSCGFWTGGSRHDGDRTPAPAGYVYGRGRGADHRIRQQTGGMACAMLKPAAFGFLRVLQKLP